MSNMLEKSSTTGDILKSIYMARRGQQDAFPSNNLFRVHYKLLLRRSGSTPKISEGDLES